MPAVHSPPSAATTMVSSIEAPSASRATTRTATSARGTRSASELKTESATESVSAGEPEAVNRRS